MSTYIKNQSSEIQKIQERGRLMTAISEDCVQINDDSFPPKEMLNIIGSNDINHYKQQMIFFFNEIANRCKVGNKSSVLDLGCGCGRLAEPFLRLCSDGRYYGFDVWDKGIGWCKENISKKYHNAYFYKVEADNNYYFNEFNSLPNAKMNLRPVEDQSVDLVFAISVFTHLVKNDCESYLHEISRVLKSGSSAYITCFIIDQFFYEYVSKTGEHKGVKESESGCFYAYSGQDFFAGYSQSSWSEMVKKAGLKIVSYESGSWAQKPGARLFQDTFILYKG